MKTIKKEFKDRIEWRNEKGKLHRENGPSVEWSDGDKHWYKNGKLHREDGPAVELNNGTKQWWINGSKLTKKQFKKYKKQKCEESMYLENVEDIKIRRDIKREWRTNNNFVVNKECCHNCRLYEKTDAMIGFCHKMSKDTGIPLIECQSHSTSSCDSFIEN